MMRGPGSSRTSRNFNHAALADFLLPGNYDLLAAVHAGTDLDFRTDGDAQFDPARVDPLAIREVDVHIRRSLRIGHDGLAGDSQRRDLGWPENASFRNHARKQHRSRVGNQDLYRVSAR